jgi:hypothetical protein
LFGLLKGFHAYLYGAAFELLTDHKPLECIFSPKSKLCARIERWLLRMQPYAFTVKYLPGPKNIADPFSRLLRPESDTCRVSAGDEYVKFVAREATPVAMTTREIERDSEHDSELQYVRECIMSGKGDCLAYIRNICQFGENCMLLDNWFYVVQGL